MYLLKDQKGRKKNYDCNTNKRSSNAISKAPPSNIFFCQYYQHSCWYKHTNVTSPIKEKSLSCYFIKLMCNKRPNTWAWPPDNLANDFGSNPMHQQFKLQSNNIQKRFVKGHVEYRVDSELPLEWILTNESIWNHWMKLRNTIIISWLKYVWVDKFHALL